MVSVESATWPNPFQHKCVLTDFRIVGGMCKSKLSSETTKEMSNRQLLSKHMFLVDVRTCLAITLETFGTLLMDTKETTTKTLKIGRRNHVFHLTQGNIGKGTAAQLGVLEGF